MMRPGYKIFIMACRGVFFAITTEQQEQLIGLPSDRDRIDYLQEVIEDAWDEEHLLEVDKAWDAIHRCLTDGSLKFEPSPDPLPKLFLGGKQLISDSDIYIINFIDHSELAGISAALKNATQEWMHSRYEKLKGTDYPQEMISEQDWRYTWEWFSAIPDFISRAEKDNRRVIFTVDQ